MAHRLHSRPFDIITFPTPSSTTYESPWVTERAKPAVRATLQPALKPCVLTMDKQASIAQAWLRTAALTESQQTACVLSASVLGQLAASWGGLLACQDEQWQQDKIALEGVAVDAAACQAARAALRQRLGVALPAGLCGRALRLWPVAVDNVGDAHGAVWRVSAIAIAGCRPTRALQAAAGLQAAGG